MHTTAGWETGPISQPLTSAVSFSGINRKSCGRIIPRKTEDGRGRRDDGRRTTDDGRQKTRGISNIEYSMSNYKVKGLNKELSEWI
jgi:hypothetical protein